MCSRAHFSSIVGFRVISIKDLSHLSLSLFASLLHGAGGSLYFPLSVVLACQLAALDETHRARQTILLPPSDACVVSNNIRRRRQIATCCRINKTLRQHRKKSLKMEIQNKSAKLAQASKQTNSASFVPLQLQLQSRKLSFLFQLVHCFFYFACAIAVVVVSLAFPTGVYFIDPTTLFLFLAPSTLVSLPSVSSFCPIGECAAPHRFSAHNKKKYTYGINHRYKILRAHK